MFVASQGTVSDISPCEGVGETRRGRKKEGKERKECTYPPTAVSRHTLRNHLTEGEADDDCVNPGTKVDRMTEIIHIN